MIMRLIEALQNSAMGEALREVPVDASITNVWAIHRKLNGYVLSRKTFYEGNHLGVTLHLEHEDTWNFHYLTDLFVTAKKQGFFAEIRPNALDWGTSSKILEYAAIQAIVDAYDPGEEAYNRYATTESFDSYGEDESEEADYEENDYEEDDYLEYGYEGDVSKYDQRFTAIKARAYYNDIY